MFDRLTKNGRLEELEALDERSSDCAGRIAYFISMYTEDGATAEGTAKSRRASRSHVKVGREDQS